MVAELERRRETVVGTYQSHPKAGLVALDIRDPAAVRTLVQEVQPEVIWLPGALPDVDRCEKEPDFSYAVNVQGPLTVLNVAREHHNVPLVFFSTDYVFDGVRGPYREDDPTHPLQVYGKHKVLAEQSLLSYEGSVIVRPAWIYSEEPNPRNFVFRILADLKAGRPIRSAADQYNTPTPAGPLARHAVDALTAGFRGILHLTGPERLTRLELTKRIAEQAGLSTQGIEAIQVQELPLPAKRPLNGGLISRFSQWRITERIADLDVTKLLTQI